MTDLTHLQNFPFKTLENLSTAFNEGKAEPIVPRDYARKWATHSPESSIRKMTSLFFAMPFLIIIGMIILANKSDAIRWYHVLSTSIASLIIFNPMASMTLGGLRKLIIYATLGFTAYLFIVGKNDFGFLLLYSLGMLFFYELTYFSALKELVAKILTNEQLLKDLWEKKIVSIRFVDGKIISIDKTI